MRRGRSCRCCWPFALLRGVRAPQLAAAGLVALFADPACLRAGALVPTVDRRAFQPARSPDCRLWRAARRRYRVVAGVLALRADIAANYGLEDVPRLPSDDIRAAGRDVPALVGAAAGVVERVDDLAARCSPQ